MLLSKSFVEDDDGTQPSNATDQNDDKCEGCEEESADNVSMEQGIPMFYGELCLATLCGNRKQLSFFHNAGQLKLTEKACVLELA